MAGPGGRSESRPPAVWSLQLSPRSQPGCGTEGRQRLGGGEPTLTPEGEPIRLQKSDHWHDLGPRRAQWVPYLLDVLARCLYGPGPDLGCMPLFEGLAGGRLSLRVFDSDWQVDVETGTPCELALETMLDWPVEPLCSCGRLWLEAGELARAGQWLRLNDDHLDKWRSIWM